MEFTVYFDTSLYSQNVIKIDSKELGLKALDYVRAKLGINLPANRVAGSIDKIIQGYVCADLTEEQARKAGHFLNCNKITVYVPNKFLNKFCYKKIKVEKDNKTGEILKVSFYWKVNFKAIKAAWFKAGCPIEWEVKEDDY